MRLLRMILAVPFALLALFAGDCALGFVQPLLRGSDTTGLWQVATVVAAVGAVAAVVAWLLWPPKAGD